MTPPYAALAAGYDVVMAHVDYPFWADYLFDLLQEHAPLAETLLELGCGTGSLAAELQPLGDYAYTATDGSAAMLRVAQAKADAFGVPIQTAELDFSVSFVIEPLVDVVVLVYDGLNYLLEEEAVLRLFRSVYDALEPGGVFVFDQSTPLNSEANEGQFEDEGEADAFAYVRRSHYDPARHLHTTEFAMTVEGVAYHEQHIQRAYPLATIRELVEQTPFVIAAVLSRLLGRTRRQSDATRPLGAPQAGRLKGEHKSNRL